MRLLVTDVGVLLLLVDERRRRIVERLFGVSRDQSWQVTLLALVLLAQAAHEKSDRVLRGPGGPTRADAMLGAATLRELLTAIPGPQARETPLVGTLVMIALVGALVSSRTEPGRPRDQWFLPPRAAVVQPPVWSSSADDHQGQATNPEGRGDDRPPA